MKTSIFFRITCTDETFTTQPLKLNSQFWFNVRFAYFTMWYIWFSSHYQISAFCWARILSVSFLSPFSIFSYYFSFSHNLCFTAVVADQYLLMSGLWALSLLYYCRASANSHLCGFFSTDWLDKLFMAQTRHSFLLGLFGLFLGFFPPLLWHCE